MKLRLPSGRTATVLGAAAILAFATGGGAVAGGMITGAQIKNGTVDTADLAPEAVGSSRVANGSLRMYDLAEGVQDRINAGGPAGPQGPEGPAGPAGPAGTAKERLSSAGLTVMADGDNLMVAAVKFGSAAEKLGIEQSFRITALEVPADRPAKEWMFIPALALLALVMWLQMGRARREKGATAVAA